MLSPESKLFCRLENMQGSDTEKNRLQTLADLGLMEAESIPVFEEATQTAAHFLDAPICILGLMDQEKQWFKSAVGLSRIGLMNDLATSRQLPRYESFCTHVVDSQQVLAISDAAAHPAFSDHLLVRRYGIRAYLGVPLIASNGHCLGTLAVMELSPRNYTTREIELLELIARWSVNEFERNYLLKHLNPSKLHPESKLTHTSSNPLSSIKSNLITQMVQELRTPLTSILGMASVLNREIYGPLTDKQKEYMDIVHNSGQYLLSILTEILELGALDDSDCALNLSPVDIEMLCQQAIATLQQAAQRREQQIRLTVEPGHRIWVLDKDKVRQMLYHLVFSVIQASSTDSTIRIHVSRKQNRLHLTVWTSHPWLGEGLPQSEIYASQLLQSDPAETDLLRLNRNSSIDLEMLKVAQRAANAEETAADAEDKPKVSSRHNLGLLLSRQLVELHGGRIGIQGSAETGYRYVVSIPQITDAGDMEP